MDEDYPGTDVPRPRILSYSQVFDHDNVNYANGNSQTQIDSFNAGYRVLRSGQLYSPIVRPMDDDLLDSLEFLSGTEFAQITTVRRAFNPQLQRR